MKLLLVFISFLIFSISSHASRLIEIEDYYSKKSSDFLKMRYPKKAFTVYVKVEVEGSGDNRRPAEVKERRVLNLPYLDAVAQDQVSFWERKDLSMGTMISYLKSVYVKVDIDQQFSNDDKEQFKSQLFQHLKLSPVYDKVEVTERVWSATKNNKQRNLLIGAGVVLLLVGFVMLFVVFQSGIRTLVKGIAGPLSDIGKSTENFSKQSMPSIQRAPQNFKEPSALIGEALADTKAELIKKQIVECESLFKSPTGVFLKTIEELGAKYPQSMGAVFRELSSETVKSLFRLGVGHWWYKAITQASPLNNDSAKIVNAVSQIKMRIELSQNDESWTDDEIKLGLFLSRCDHKMFGTLLKEVPFEEASLVLKMIPRDLMIKVSKYLYPGQWAELLREEGETGRVDASVIKSLTQEVLRLNPLKDESIVNQYFIEADMTRYLDEAVTKDEREIYRAISEDHRIKKERTPFYEVFQSHNDVIHNLSLEVSLDEWAMVLNHCDQDERDKITEQMTERQKYMLGQALKQRKGELQNIDDIIWAKRKIVSLCHYYVSQRSVEEAGDILEAAV